MAPAASQGPAEILGLGGSQSGLTFGLWFSMWKAYGLNQHDPLIGCDFLGMSSQPPETHTYARTCTDTHAHKHICAHTHICMHTRAQTRHVQTRTHPRTHRDTHMHAHTHMHACTHRHTPAHSRHTHAPPQITQGGKLGTKSSFSAEPSSPAGHAPLSCPSLCPPLCLHTPHLPLWVCLWPAEPCRKSRKTDIFKTTEALRGAWSPEARSSLQDGEGGKHNCSKHTYVLSVHSS